ncbi:MAG: hypothetical protein JW917_07705 [Ignavibacteria bacterium]|nr:hypothetical protein [Ignavibacteria bacterium]
MRKSNTSGIIFSSLQCLIHFGVCVGAFPRLPVNDFSSLEIVIENNPASFGEL